MKQDLIIHVAFADDHNLMRTAVTKILQDSGSITVAIEAENGQELLDKLGQAAVLPEICIIDVSMPVMDGFTAMVEIRKRWPEMKTLILTAFSSEHYVIRMMQAGANGYLLKKCSESEIIEAIRSIHEYGYYYSDCANSSLFHLIKTKAIKTIKLSEQEIEYIRYSCTDLKISEISKKMKKTEAAVGNYRDSCYEKLNIHTRLDLAMFAVVFGFVTVDINPKGNLVIPQFKNS